MEIRLDAENGDGREDTLYNAPETKGDMFVAPKTFE